MPSSPPPIALSSLRIRDFRGIGQLDLDFRGPDGSPNQLAVLAGPNGSGKTAVLEAALIAVGGHKLATGPRGKRAIRRGASTYTLSAELQRSGVTLSREDRPHLPPPNPDPPIPHWYFSSWRAPRLEGPVEVTAGRPGRKSAKTDRNRLRNVKQLLVNAAAIERFKSPFLHSYSEWIKSINEYWNRFYPTGGQFTVGLVEDAADPESPGQGAFEVFLDSPNGNRLEVDLLSAGQLELFLFLAALALNDDRDGIIFIDEPELHLDPQWHALIVRSLIELQPRAQFVVATHSPEIFHAAMSYERHFLIPTDDPRATAWHPEMARS